MQSLTCRSTACGPSSLTTAASRGGVQQRQAAGRCNAAAGWRQQQRVALSSRVSGGGSGSRSRRGGVGVRAVVDPPSAFTGGGGAIPGAAEDADDYEAASEKAARDIALELAVIADETRAADVRVLGVSRKVHWARYFILATAFNRPQMQAVASKMRDHLNEVHGQNLAKNVTQQGDWVCVDCGDVVVHVFTPSARQFYDIETLYGDAVDVELPFETERPQEDEFEVF